MFFGKLLPKEGNFFELFNQHAEQIVKASHAFSQLVAHYSDPLLRDKYTGGTFYDEAIIDARRTHAVNKAFHYGLLEPDLRVGAPFATVHS